MDLLDMAVLKVDVALRVALVACEHAHLHQTASDDAFAHTGSPRLVCNLIYFAWGRKIYDG